MHPQNTPESETGFFGIFDTLNKMDLPLTEVTDPFTGFHAKFFDLLTKLQDEHWDVPIYLRLAEANGGPVLELGCGSGRVTLPLARGGLDTTGLDFSEDMLNLLRRRLINESQEVIGRTHLVEADMTDFDLDQNFGLIVLPGYNIGLLNSDEQRISLLNCVTKHLAPDGLFAFDFFVPNEGYTRGQDSRTYILPASTPSVKQFALLGQLFIPEKETQLLNFYTETIDEHGTTRRFLSSMTTAILQEDRLLRLLSEANLRVAEVEETEFTEDNGLHRLRKLFVCQRAPA